MKREIKFSLVFRDMWQSATKLEKCLKLTYGFFIKNMKRVRTFRIFASLKTICN